MGGLIYEAEGKRRKEDNLSAACFEHHILCHPSGADPPLPIPVMLPAAIQLAGKSSLLKYMILRFAFFMLALSAYPGLYNIGSILSEYYTVPNNYICVSDYGMGRIGTGFIHQIT